jgi:hypothetical protein
LKTKDTRPICGSSSKTWTKGCRACFDNLIPSKLTSIFVKFR